MLVNFAKCHNALILRRRKHLFAAPPFAMCEAVCDVGGVTVSKAAAAVELSVLPPDSDEVGYPFS